jgi:hypothetical protein
MATAKSFVATGLLAAILGALFLGTLLVAATATAGSSDRPTMRINGPDQARASSAVLRPRDFPLGWRGGRTRPEPLEGPQCPGFEPKQADLVVTGRAAATFTNGRGGVEISQESQVLESVAAVKTDFARTVTPRLAACLEYQYRRDPNILGVSVQRLDFPRIGTYTAAFRATLLVRSSGKPAKVLSDFVFVGNGRMEYSLNLVAPARFEPQLPAFAEDILRILVKRGGGSE